MKKRIVSLITAIACAAVPLASCGEKAPQKSKVDHVYKSSDLGLGDIRTDNILANDKTIIVSGTEALGSGSQYVVINVDFSSGADNLSSVKRVIELSDSESVSATALEPDGDVLLLKSDTNKDGKTTFSLDRLGDEVVTICDDVGSLIESDGSDSLFDGKDLYLTDLAVDSDGRIYVGCGYAIAVLDSDCSKLFEISVPGRMDTLSSTADGRVYASFLDNSYTGQIRFIDTETKKFGGTLNLPDMSSYSNAALFVGPGYDLYIKDDDAIRGVDLNSVETVELLNFMNSDFNGNAVRYAAVIDADTIVLGCIDTYGTEPEYGVWLMTRVPDDEIPEKVIIRVACNYNGFPMLRKDVISFNRQSDEYRVELVDYNQFEPIDEYDYDNSKLLERELLSGEAPDIIVTTDFSAADEWMDKGAFTDLSKYADEEFLSGYFDSVLSICVDRKGRMYQFITDFRPQTVAASKEFVKPDRWDIDGFLDFASALPEGKFLLEYTSPVTMTEFTLGASLDSFIDFKKAECDFDTPTFKRLLEYLKGMETALYRETLSGDDLRDYELDAWKPYRDGDVLLIETGATDLRSYLQAATCFGDGKSKFIGYPAGSRNGTLVKPRTGFAINEKSGFKDAAWDFIRFIAENGTANSNSFPSNVGRFDKLCAGELGNYYYFEGSGSMRFESTVESEVTAELEKRIRKGDYDGSGVLAKVDEACVASLKDMINNAGPYPDAEWRIISMISDESRMYFAGEKSLEDTIKIIQDRVSTYLAEKK